MEVAAAANRTIRAAKAPETLSIGDFGTNQRGTVTALLRPNACIKHLAPYADSILNAIRTVIPDATHLESGERWVQLKLMKVPLDIYYSSNSMNMLEQHMQADGLKVALHRPLRWLATEDAMLERLDRGVRWCPVVITTSQEGARELLAQGVSAGGHRYKVLPWEDFSPESLCFRCASWGHPAFSCKATPRCVLCAGPHLLTHHACLVQACPARKQKGMQCQHLAPKCSNCPARKRADHRDCPARPTPPPAQPTQILTRDKPAEASADAQPIANDSEGNAPMPDAPTSEAASGTPLIDPNHAPAVPPQC